jgi:hypothetical protein
VRVRQLRSAPLESLGGLLRAVRSLLERAGAAATEEARSKLRAPYATAGVLAAFQESLD